MTVDEFIDNIKTTAEGYAGRFTDPDDDFAPALMLMREEDDKGTFVGIDPGFFEDDRGKVALVKVVIPELIRDERPDAVAFACSTYQTKVERDTGKQVSRTEALMVIVYSRDGGIGHITAEIVRSKSLPPMLGPWDCARLDQEEGAHAEGLFDDALRVVQEPEGGDDFEWPITD